MAILQLFIPVQLNASILANAKKRKDFVLLRLKKKVVTTHEFIKTPTRPFIQIEVKLKEHQDQTEQLLDQLQQHDINDAIVKILYHVPAGKKDTVNLSLVLQACASAMHVVNITPVHAPETREKRSVMNISMDLKTLVSTYLEGKNTAQSDSARLLEKALALQQEALNEEFQEES